MPQYEYQAIDINAKRQQGQLEAVSSAEARHQLRQQGLTVLSCQEILEKKKSFMNKTFLFSPFNTFTLTIISQQLSTLLTAGIPLEAALFGVAMQTEKKIVKGTLLKIRQQVFSGYPFSQALREFPAFFPAIYVGTVAAGEQSGQLTEVLHKMAEHLEKRHAIQQKIQQALIYPALMLSVSLGIVSFLLIYVIPKIMEVFETTGQTLPMLTRALLWSGTFMQQQGWIFLFILLALFSAGYYLSKNNLAFQRLRDRWYLQLPFIRQASKIINTTRFSSTLSILLSATVPVLEAIRMSADVVSNHSIREGLLRTVEQIKEGVSIAKAFQQTRYFSPMSIQLISSGEASGQLENMLMKVASFQETRMTHVINTLLSLFEPLMILVMGSIVLTIVLAVLLPIFSMNQLLE